MDHRYHPKDTAWKGYFTYLDDNGSRVTGKVDGDWTKELVKGTGTVSSTGITVVEVDPTNHKGLYVAAASATDFPATEGAYDLTIYESGEYLRGHRETITVANSNDYSSATAEFTATAANGRVTDGTNPIEGANVILVDGSGNRVTEVTTDASGLWGPVYLTSTVTAYVQNDGYGQETATITVAGTSATGPGTDIAMSATTSTNQLKASTLIAYTRRRCQDRTGTTTDTRIYEIVNEAVQKVARDTHSQWFRSTFDVDMEADYNTGNLVLTSGSTTATLSGGTWPTNAALGFISVDGKIHQIASRTSNTVVVLDTAWQDAATTTSNWRWGRYQYDLDDDIYRITQISYGSNKTWEDEPVSWSEFQRLMQSSHRFGSSTFAWCIANGALNVWPTPTDEMFVTLTGYRRPAQITTASDVADVDPIHVELLHRAIDYKVCLYYKETEGGMTWEDAERNYKIELAANTDMDRKGAIRVNPLSVPRGMRRGRRNIADVRDVPTS